MSAENASVSLTALEAQGGIGKTRLAAEFVWRHGEQDFPGGVFWLAGEQDRARQLHHILSELKPDTPPLAVLRKQGVDLKKGLLERLINALKLHKPGERKLWVVDNLPEPEAGQPVALEGWFPDTSHLSVLFTSRVKLIQPGLVEFPLGPLSFKASQQLLVGVRALDDEQTGQARAIIEAVGRLPLALEILAVEFREGTSLEELAERLTGGEPSDEVDMIMEDLREFVAVGNLRGVAETLALSYERLDEETRRLARVLACLGPEPLPSSLVGALGEDLASTRRLRRLRQRHFLTGHDHEKEKEEEGQMHRLLASFLRGQGDLREDMTMAREALRREWERHGDDGISRGRLPILPHVEAWHAHLDRLERERHDTVMQEDDLCLLHDLADHHRQNADFEQARQLEEHVLEARREVLDPRHPDTLSSMNNLAQTLHAMGELQQARQLFEQVLEASREVLGERHPGTLTSMNNLAQTLQAMGELQQARQLEEHVLEVRREVLGERHPGTLTSMGNLALTLRVMGEHQQARQLEEQVLEASREVLGERHPDTLISMGNLAQTLKAMGELQQARPLEEQALEASREVLGERHPDTLISMGNLAQTLKAMGELQQARPLEEQALEASREVLGECHPDTLTAMNNLASTLVAMGELQQARQLFEHVLEARREVLGPRHPDTLTSMNNLAYTLHAMGEHQQAQEILKQRPSATSTFKRQRKLGRNEPCHCGSGRKYKKCCLRRDD